MAMLISAVLSLILPFLTQSVVDTGIGNNNLSFVIMILIAQVVLTLGQWQQPHPLVADAAYDNTISISLISDFFGQTYAPANRVFRFENGWRTLCSASEITTGFKHF